MRDRLLSEGEAIWDALQRLVREIAARKSGGHLIDGRLPAVDLPLPSARDGRREERAEFAAALLASVEQRIDDAIEAEAAFQPGHAYCHRCDAAACEHSRPPSPRHVFIGYAASGAPYWQEFAQHCLELRHPEVDRLFDDPPAVVTFVRGRSELYGALPDPLRSDGRELLGQVIAGFFGLPPRAREGRGVIALTLQAVASRGADGRVRIGLNLLGVAPQGEDLAILWERQQDLAWRRAIRWGQGALETVVRHAHPRPAGMRAAVAQGAAPNGGVVGRLALDERLERRVKSVLGGLARRLEQEVRGRVRRTAHADERHLAGERPTRKAIDDIMTARPDAFLVDERSGAVVVLGDRGRTHFFTPEGRLVSSARYSRDAIARKRQQGIWRPLPPDQARAARDAVIRSDREATGPAGWSQG